MGAADHQPRRNESAAARARRPLAGAVGRSAHHAARVLAETSYGGCVAASPAGGADLPTTVMPFILRNVSLRGVDSVMCPVERRKAAWPPGDRSSGRRARRDWRVDLEELPALAEQITEEDCGRVIVDPNR